MQVGAMAHLERTERPWFQHLLWVLAAAVLGFLISAIFAGILRLSRGWFLVVYLILTAPFLIGYVGWSQIDVAQVLRRHRGRGVIGALLAGALLVASVQRMPSSPWAEGAALLWDILWLGIVYGSLDALLLTVLPVLATWRALSDLRWTRQWPGKIAAGAVAFAASLGVTAAYHLGYVEFRGPQVVDPLIGNGVMTLGYLLTGNPITAIGAHIALHVASVLHGVETTVTLPPHY
jgi:hypothetical protein